MYQELPRPTIFAHRGSSTHAPENTITAFELAVSQKADAIELDAKLCADGEVVVFHDQTIDRTSNGSGRVAEYPLAALKELDAGSWFGAEFARESIPTLGEVFEAVGKKIFINIELTNYASIRDDLPGKVVDLVRKHNLEETVFFSSFNPLALRKTHRLLPEAPLGLLAFPGVAGAWARSWLGHWIVPYQALNVEVSNTSSTLITRQHKKGHHIFSWTANDPEDIKRLFRLGVDGIFTDDPPLAQEIRDQVLS